MSAVMAGWYEDPWENAAFRFWDGSAWTAATSAGATPTASVGAPTLDGLPHADQRGATDQQKGAALEQQVANLLRSQGYSVQTNLVLTGRSGAPHELDVVGEKRDQLTTFRLAVECKAWRQPIEKDVVAKFSYVLGDVGIREGVIACLGGYRSGAATAAREMGVTLWGPDELRTHLGGIAVTDVATRAPQHLASGFPFAISIEQAQSLFEREVKGKLGFGAEQIVWRSAAWLPVAIVQVALSQTEGRLKKVVQTRRVWNMYEMIDGAFVGSFQSSPTLCDIDLMKQSIRPVKKEASFGRTIGEAVANYDRVTTEQARARHAQRLQQLGIPAPYRAVAESASCAFLPIFVALARRKDGERVVAVDALNRTVHTRVSSMLSKNVQWLRDSFQ